MSGNLLPEYHFVDVCSVSDLGAGERLEIELGKFSVILLKVGDQFHAIGNLCTHDNGPIGEGEIEGDEIICPRHGARFDINSGKATHLPAVVGIPIFPVRINGDLIQVGIPE